jgi:hypothetical protein
LKHLIVLSGYATVGLLATLFLMGADRAVVVPCGQDLDATVNSDETTIGTRFQLEGPCTYPVDTMVILKNGDELVGPQGTFIERGPAFDPEPTVTIVGDAGVINVIAARGKVRLEWVKIVGGNGQFSADGSPVHGTGSGLTMPSATNDSSLYAVHITGSDAAGITNARGTFERIELDETTQDPSFLGFNGSGMKAVTEVEVKDSYIHNNQGNGLWCDEFCHDSANHPNGFWVHDNLVVNNGRAGIRFERVGDIADSGEALIENNQVHGNSAGELHGGVNIVDAQDALVRNNVFGATSIADVAYSHDASGVAIRATDSGRADRPDLWNVDIVDNVLNGETIVGCGKPDDIVYCQDNTAPTVSSVVPTDGAATGIALDANVEASFSEAMDVSTITDAKFTLTLGGSGATSVAAAVSYDPTTHKATLNPNVALEAGKTYSAKVKGGSTGVRDLAGNPLAADKVWSFTTLPPPPPPPTSPRVTSTIPTAGATGVAPSANLTATFSEKMDLASITKSTFKLLKVNADGSTTQITNVTVSLSTDGLKATLNPFGTSTTTHLARGSKYKGVITTGARDEAGSPLDQNTTADGFQSKAWTFTVSP